MPRRLLPALASLALVLSAVDEAGAQCAFEHPKKAKKFQSSFTTAFIGCGGYYGDTPNTTTEGGVPACKPPETFNQQAGYPPNGWTWDELKGQGQVQLKSAVAMAPITPVDSTDITVKLKLQGVLDNNFNKGAGNGTLSTVARVTLDDRMNGDMTIVDFPASFPFTMTDGKVSMKTSADAILNGIGQPGLPHCSSLELVYLAINDPAGTQFADVGLFLP